MRQLFITIAIALVCVGCEPDTRFVSTTTVVPSRGLEIPATFVHPASAAGASVPLVVMAHGHGGTRDEAGAFVSVAAALAEQGIASIRVDFPGCGDSREPFTENILTNMLQDIRASRKFAAGHPRIDADRTGILGYSMGGRLAILATERERYSAVVVWAPAAGDGIDSMVGFLGGPERFAKLRAQAEADGFAVLETLWGARQQLSLEWFTDLEDSRPQSVISHYDGALLVLHGSNDRVIEPRFGEAVLASATRARVLAEQVVEGAGHGLGFYNKNEEMAAEVVAVTVRFLGDNL